MSHTVKCVPELCAAACPQGCYDPATDPAHPGVPCLSRLDGTCSLCGRDLSAPRAEAPAEPLPPQQGCGLVCVPGMNCGGCPTGTPANPAPERYPHPRNAEAAVDQLLTALGVPRDEHTADTPGRVARALTELLAGYTEDPDTHLARTFPGPDDAGLVVLAGIRFTSLCAHHLLPFTGTATVAYLPSATAPIVGLSKLARVVEGYARRLQTQELLGAQVADAVYRELTPAGAACIITSHHACMGIRGVRQPDAVMTTSALRGSFRTDPAQRAELLSLHQSAARGVS